MSWSIIYLLQDDDEFIVGDYAMVECVDGWTDGHVMATEQGKFTFKGGKMVKMAPGETMNFKTGNYAIVGPDDFITKLALGIDIGRQIEQDHSLRAILN